MLGCKNRKKPFKLSPGSTTSGDDGKLASSANTQHVSKVAKMDSTSSCVPSTSNCVAGLLSIGQA